MSSLDYLRGTKEIDVDRNRNYYPPDVCIVCGAKATGPHFPNYKLGSRSQKTRRGHVEVEICS